MFKTICTSIFIITLFSGCISLTKELPAYKTYTLGYEQESTNTVKINKTIKVYEPKALTSVNSKAINYSKDSFISDKYALSKWSDKPTKMLQQNITSYLSNTKTYKYVTSSNIKIDTDYKLVSELVDFKQTFTKNSSYADFSIRVYLINNNSDNVFFKSFTYNEKAKLNNAEGMVEAINNISTTFLKDLNNFLASSIE